MQFTTKNRYARQIILPQIGEVGQKKLIEAKILVIGAGGLGSPALLYLAAAGIGTIGIVDFDVVELSNLQRQVLFEISDLKHPKVEAAAAALADLNPEINIITHQLKLDDSNIDEVISGYDIVLDGSDNYTTRFLVNDKCIEHKKPLVSAAILAFSGQISVFKGYNPNQPCYRCVYADIPPEGTMPSCSTNGILGSIAGTMGTLMATEAVKEVLQIGESLSGYLLVYDGLKQEFRKVKLHKDEGCITCHPAA
jgi:molybdopterin/thiamine biosynthesis adenylyltransferase